MRARVLTALVGIPVFLGFLFAGGLAWLTFLAVLIIIAGYEMGRFYERLGYSNCGPWIVAGGLIILLAAYTSDGNAPFVVPWPLVMTLIMGLALIRELLIPGHLPLQRGAAVCLGSMYVGLFAFLYMARADSITTALTVVLATWSADTAAFLVGRALGQTAFAPTISPNKTVEGAIAGVLGGMSAGVVLGLMANQPPWPAALLGAMVALAAEAGDLVESAMKREAGVKDAGSILPGHGGILDRFDSMLFAGVAVYLLRLML